MKDFLFKPEQARTPDGVLSGGERGRLLLACAIVQAVQPVDLDEPTNDLDLETLDLLQSCSPTIRARCCSCSPTIRARVLLVSHDRDFLDRVVTSTITGEGDGHWTEYAGGYSDMLAQRGPVTPPPALASKAAAKPAGRPAKSGKMSFKDKHALETLPAQMEQLQQRIATLQVELAAPDLYRKNPTRFAAATKELETAQNSSQPPRNAGWSLRCCGRHSKARGDGGHWCQERSKAGAPPPVPFHEPKPARRNLWHLRPSTPSKAKPLKSKYFLITSWIFGVIRWRLTLQKIHGFQRPTAFGGSRAEPLLVFRCLNEAPIAFKFHRHRPA